VDPVSETLFLRKSGSVGNQIRTSGSVVKNSDHRGGPNDLYALKGSGDGE
jgi:hypothetical protein